MANFSLSDATTLTNSLKGLKKPAILLLGFFGFCYTLTKLDDDKTPVTEANTDDVSADVSADEAEAESDSE